MREKGIIERVNGKRDGSWIIKEEKKYRYTLKET